MIINNKYSKLITFLSLVSSVFSRQVTGDCKEIEDLLTLPDYSYYDNFITECKVNDNGEVTNL